MIVLRRILFLLANFLLLLAFVFRFIARRVLRKKARWLRVDLRGDVRFLPRRQNYTRFLKGFGPPIHEVDLRGLERSIDAAIKLPAVEGVIVVVHPLGGGFAAMSSLRDLLRKIVASGRRCIVFLPRGGGMKELFVASAGGEIVVGKGSTLLLGGLSASTTYWKGALDRAGIDLTVHRRSEYKTAMEPYARESMSDEQREQTELLLGGIDEAIREAVAKARQLDPETVRAILERPILVAEEAVSLGLADRVAYEDELENLMARREEGPNSDALASEVRDDKRQTNQERAQQARFDKRAQKREKNQFTPLPLSIAPKLVEPQDFLPLRSLPLIALIRVEGAIMDAGETRASYDRLKRALRWARASKAIRGVLLYVDSPGGSALASQLIHRELVRLREKKPVMAYFGNVAASGGYYVGVGAQKIFANPYTITGSIGVIAAKPSLARLQEKLGLRVETVKTGPSADFFALHRSHRPEESEAFEAFVDAHYRDFVAIVAEGRGQAFDAIEEKARGRVYLGKEAHALGLVDGLGGIGLAFDELKRAMGLPKEMKVGVIEPRERGLRAPLPEPPRLARELVKALAIAELSDYMGLATSRDPVLYYEPTLSVFYHRMRNES